MKASFGVVRFRYKISEGLISGGYDGVGLRRLRLILPWDFLQQSLDTSISYCSHIILRSTVV